MHENRKEKATDQRKRHLLQEVLTGHRGLLGLKLQ
jgi:hypothetical protein